MNVGLAGSGPAVEAIEAAVRDIDVDAIRIDAAEIDSVDVGVVVGVAGSGVFEQANHAADGPWFAVELGGVGGHPIADLDAAISGFSPDTGCFSCLHTRVAATLDDRTEPEPKTTRSDARLAGAVTGRAVIALLAGDSDVLGRVRELPHADRYLLPAPGCSCGATPQRELGRDDDDVPLDEAIDRVERAVDDRVGIVRSIGEAHSFPAPYYLASLCDTTGFSDVQASEQAAGVAVDWNEAFMKALGEALERYSAGVYRESDLTVAPVADLSDVVTPTAFVLPEDGFDHPDPDEPIAWVPGERLDTGDIVHLPAEFVQFPPVEQRHRPSITTGLGLGSSTVGALLSGLYEVIERDATMLSWYSTFEPLELDTDDPVVETLTRRVRSEDLSVTLLFVTQDVDVPVVTAAVHRETDWPQFAVGSGAAIDPNRAARSALTEAVQNWMELRSMGPDRASEQEPTLAQYADFPSSARRFVDVDRSVSSASVGPDDLPGGVDELEAVIERAADADLDVYGAHITPRDVESLGFEASRVLIPTAQPLFTETRYFGERARRVPRELGFQPRLDREPHPYP